MENSEPKLESKRGRKQGYRMVEADKKMKYNLLKKDESNEWQIIASGYSFKNISENFNRLSAFQCQNLYQARFCYSLSENYKVEKIQNI